MKPIIRVDDFPFTKPEELWRHNLENFKRFDDVLASHGIQEYTLGVIPKYTTDEHIKWLADNQRITVALHGINHDERFLNEFQEFETEEDILRKIRFAKKRLAICNSSNNITRYIPPHNEIDHKTCRALKRDGFDMIFGGPGSHTEMYKEVLDALDIKMIYSEHPTWYGRSDELRNRDNAVKVILEDDGSLQRCLTLHWTWEMNIGFENLDIFMSDISKVFT